VGSRVYDRARWRELRGFVLRRDGFRCVYCGATANLVDHVVPLAAGGSAFDPANLKAATGFARSEAVKVGDGAGS
jgi:5-methylcytosine-specific restriction endonuclease McrA